jgi:hypothetical protein
MRRTSMVLGSAVLTVAGLMLAPGSAGADVATGQVLSVTADPGPFVVSGFAGQAQSIITVVIDEPRGTIGGNSDWYYTGVEVDLTRTSGGPTQHVFLDLPRVSAAGSVGTYSTPWRIAASRSGTWTLTGLRWDGVGIGPTFVDPRVSPGVTRTITVTGTAAPSATVVRIPTVVPYRDTTPPYAGPSARQWARVTYRSSTGAPLVGATVVWGHEYACNTQTSPPPPGSGSGQQTTLRTDSHGQVTVRLVWDTGPGFTCLSLLGPPAVAGGDPTTRALVRQDWPYPLHSYKSVVAAATPQVVRTGRTVTVSGTAYPAKGSARLQRLVGRTWHTVASAHIRPSSRFTLTVKAGAPGRGLYRVVATGGDPTLAPTASSVFTVTSTRR